MSGSGPCNPRPTERGTRSAIRNRHIVPHTLVVMYDGFGMQEEPEARPRNKRRRMRR